MAAQTSPERRRITRDEYHRMIELGFFQRERLELIHGSLLQMSPIGPPHASVVSKLTRLLILQLHDRAEVRPQQSILAHDDSEPEPDVAIVPLADYSEQHPDRAFLVIEVAESSSAYDRDTKGPLYAASSVEEYWIVDIAGRAIEVYSEPVSGRYDRTRRAGAGDTVTPAAFTDVAISVTELLGSR